MIASSNFIITLLQFIIAFSLIVFFHELGHYAFSKLFKVEVEEFGFGFPPRLIKLFKIKETEFTLNWIPFGAFVRPKGENDPAVAGGLAAANPWKRLGVLFGGPLMNLLIGLIIFSFIFSKTGAPDTTRTIITDINPGSPADTAGFEINDIIISVNGTMINNLNDVSPLVRERLGEAITIRVLRANVETDIQVTPRVDPPEGQGPLGIVMGYPYKELSFWQAIPSAARNILDQGYQLITLPAKLISGQISGDQARMVSPKGLFDIYSQVREEQATTEGSDAGLALLNILWFFGIISVALGFTNLLPIPALDGGRILFLLPEILFKKRVPAQYENTVHMVGYTLLLALMAYLLIQDIINPVILP